METWAMTSAEARCPREPTTRLELAFIAMLGSTTVARNAGARPKSNVVDTASRVVKTNMVHVGARSSTIAAEAIGGRLPARNHLHEQLAAE